MRRAIKVLLLAAVVVIVSAPARARAESYVNPWAGIVFGNDEAQTGFHSFGVSAGDTGSRTGFDFNLGYAPHFFDAESDDSVLDLMVGLTAGPLIGRSKYSARPYVVGGVGLLRTSFSGTANNDFGFNVGGGLIAYFSDHFGLRGEFRYYRTLNGDDLGSFNFTRAQIGLMLR